MANKKENAFYRLAVARAGAFTFSKSNALCEAVGPAVNTFRSRPERNLFRNLAENGCNENHDLAQQ